MIKISNQRVSLGVGVLLVLASLSQASAVDMMTTSATMMMQDAAVSQDLMMGSKGDAVVTLQTTLEEKGYLMMPEGVAKGYFGMMTKNALKKYQMSLGVSATGYFGPLTRAKWMAMSGDGMMKHDTMMADSMMKKDTMMAGTMSGDSMMMNKGGVMVGGAMMLPMRDIVDNAVLADNVTTVVAAVKAAGLVDTLKSAGPFTVFAPNNGAFGKLPAGTVETLLMPENKSKLADILTYHVVAGRYTSADLTDGLTLKTVEGKTLKFTRVNGYLLINGSAMVETPDVISSNGVTHVINKVLMPTDSRWSDMGVEVGGALMVMSKDIVDNAVAANNVTTVVAAVKAAGLVDTLKSKGPFTVFAPDNAAFDKLPAGTVATLLMPENKAKLADILTYHVVAGSYKIGDLMDGQVLTTVEGKTLRITKANGHVMINGSAMIKTPNVISSNGVTHVIDTVLLP